MAVKICIVSSCGGHLTEVRRLLPAFQDSEYFYVVNDRIKLPEDMEGRTCFIRHSERDVYFFVNLWEAYRILSAAQPDLIISTGAGPVVPFAIIGRLLFGTKIVFIETITRISEPSLTARIMYRLAHRFFYQWPQQKRFFPRGVYGGQIL